MSDIINEYIFQFPTQWQFDVGTTIDDAVKGFSKSHQSSLYFIKQAVISAVGGINTILTVIPWFVIVLAVVMLAWKLTRKWYTGVLYGAMLVFIGTCGFWLHMMQTLSIVIAGVILSIILGFPIGVIITVNKRVNSILRPVLDTMQTMPSWVYLVPAVILFGVGTTPALLATTIYSIVPIIRLTSHGLLCVDQEMVEAAYAYGSTKMQALIKVQIPQAKPTIMTGVNQTIMMAMSMVVTCALIGANGLGMEILVATNRVDMGKALFPGICIVILAIILDRLTQAAVKQSEVRDDV